jgi:5-methylcytosine-specific restriction endonuclease McrA
LKCRSEAVTRRRRRVKQLLVREAGGACQACGYDRCIGALEFHHLDPAEKSFTLSHRGVTRSLAKARAEAEKCVLLCSNCHVEVELGLRVLS